MTDAILQRAEALVREMRGQLRESRVAIVEGVLRSHEVRVTGLILANNALLMRARLADDDTLAAIQSLHGATVALIEMVADGSLWGHVTGNQFRVLHVANQRGAKHPITVVYQNVENGEVYARPLADWHHDMSPQP